MDKALMIERRIAEFTEGYMEKLFYFCLKKTGNSTEAEDLTQEIALHIITALQKGVIPTSFSAWVWKIARNRYSVWADETHRRADSVTGSDIGDYEIEDKSENILDEMIHCEQLALLRRELAFLKRDYHDIIVAYYLEDRSVRDIAASLSLSVCAVQQRLHRARILLKEGMDMARTFGKRSYATEEVSFVKNGKDGETGQPWAIVTHLLYKNIFLETYQNPETAEELALELGIALPYMEDELEYLVKEEFLRRSGNRYETNFRIVSRDEQRAVYDRNKKIQKPLTEKICELIDLYMEGDGSKVNAGYVGYDAAKWTLLVRTFDRLCWDSKEHDYNCMQEYKMSYPSRPDHGAWTLTGYERIDWKEPPFVGKHGYQSYDPSEIIKDIDFGQFKFVYKDHQEKTPEYLTYPEVYTLWLVCAGQAAESDKSHVEKLTEYGYLKKGSGAVEPNVVVFNRNAEMPDHPELTAKLAALKNEICALINQAPSVSRGYVVEQALENGWLQYDENTINTIGAYICL